MDNNVANIVKKLWFRAEQGMEKYGVSTERTDYNPLDWLNELQQELMDGCVYIEAMLTSVNRENVKLMPLPGSSRRQPLQAKVVLHNEDAQMPTKAHASDACFDIYASERLYLATDSQAIASTGISIQAPKGHCIIVRSRSGLAFNQSIEAFHGTIDEGYTGEIKVRLKNDDIFTEHFIEIGDKIAQIQFVPVPEVYLTQVDALDPSDRASGGFGSTGK